MCSARYADSAFSGIGASMVGGRWNSPGRAVVYCAASLELAILEILVHVDRALAPPDLVFFKVPIATGLSMEVLSPEDLPSGWRGIPAPMALAALGDAWIARAQSAVLAVPSAVSPEGQNLLLNPRHPDLAGLVIPPAQRLVLDPRLLDGASVD